MLNKKHLVPVLVIVLLLVACGPAASPTATAPPTRAGVATPTQLPASTATPTPAATATPRMTATPARTSPKYGGTLTTAFWDTVPTWDVFSTTTLRVQIPLSFVYDRLFVYKTQPGCTLEVEPSLAKTWKWVNDTTFEVGLQPGARFANRPPVNGREITADDVVYSFTVQLPRQPGVGPFLKYSVDRVEAVDKGTVRFVLKMPNAFFVDRAFARAAYVVAKETFDAQNRITEATGNVGSGPFILAKDVPGVSVNYARNPGYWQKGIPYLDGLQYRIIPDFGTQMALFRVGALDYTYWQALHPLIQDAQRRLKDYELQICVHTQPPVLGMVTDVKPFNDVRVRRAISMAIDRENLLKSAYLGMGRVAATAIAPAQGELFMPLEELPPEARRYLQYDPKEAKRLLAEAGYPDGIKVRVWNNRLYGMVFGAMAESLVDSFRAAGIAAEIYSPEPTLFQDKWFKGEWDGLLLAWQTGPDLYQIVFDNYHSLGARSGSSYRLRDSALDGMIDKLTVTFDKEGQKKLARQLQIYIVENVPNVSMPLTVNAGVVGKWVKGAYYVPTWDQWVDHLRYAWIDK